MNFYYLNNKILCIHNINTNNFWFDVSILETITEIDNKYNTGYSISILIKHQVEKHLKLNCRNYNVFNIYNIYQKEFLKLLNA